MLLLPEQKKGLFYQSVGFSENKLPIQKVAIWAVGTPQFSIKSMKSFKAHKIPIDYMAKAHLYNTHIIRQIEPSVYSLMHHNGVYRLVSGSPPVRLLRFCDLTRVKVWSKSGKVTAEILLTLSLCGGLLDYVELSCI